MAVEEFDVGGYHEQLAAQRNWRPDPDSPKLQAPPPAPVLQPKVRPETAAERAQAAKDRAADAQRQAADQARAAQRAQDIAALKAKAQTDAAFAALLRVLGVESA
jgi:hypothetical protein